MHMLKNDFLHNEAYCRCHVILKGGTLMSIRYVCRYCAHQMGQITRSVVSEEELGFQMLTQEEKESIVVYEENGDMLVQVVCEHCQETLHRYPELILHSKIHQ